MSVAKIGNVIVFQIRCPSISLGSTLTPSNVFELRRGREVGREQIPAWEDKRQILKVNVLVLSLLSYAFSVLLRIQFKSMVRKVSLLKSFYSRH